MSVTGLNAGDILLSNNRTKNRGLNIAGQKLLRRNSSVNTTHVALSLGDGIFIHANTSCGVDLVFFPDLIKNSDENWKVIRSIEIKDETEEKIKKSGIFHLNKSYSYRFILKRNETSLFCSQFVELVYKTIGINIFSREEGKGLFDLNNALPVDFERLITDDKRWNDVTNIYLENVNDGFFEHLKYNFQQQLNLIIITRNMRARHSDALDLVSFLNESHDLLPDEHKNKVLENHLSDMIEDLNDTESTFFYDFWNVKSKRNKKSS